MVFAMRLVQQEYKLELFWFDILIWFQVLTFYLFITGYNTGPPVNLKSHWTATLLMWSGAYLLHMLGMMQGFSWTVGTEDNYFVALDRQMQVKKKKK